jgi:iron(III) transport system substrate-binding protein
MINLKRSVLAGACVLAAWPAFAEPLTPSIIEAAKKEGKITFYTSGELLAVERVGKMFEAKYPEIKVTVERNGSERIFQRLGQESTANINVADVVNTSDAAHYLVWKRDGLLAKSLPDDVEKIYPAAFHDPDSFYASWRSTLTVMGYNTNLVKAEEAPKSFADLLDPKWSGKLVKAHPGYSGIIMTATYSMVKILGWDYFEKLAKQKVMQVQSSAETPRKTGIGERPVMVDGPEFAVLTISKQGTPIKLVYPTEGTPFSDSPAAILAKAPHPNAARVFMNYLFSLEGQQDLVNSGFTRSGHPDVKLPPEMKPLKDIKYLQDDPAEVEKQSNEIKRQYRRLFGS